MSTLLLVMPSSSERTNLENILRDGEWKVALASSSAQAAKLVGRKPPTVIICGERFPGGDWKQFLSEMESTGQAAPTIVASHHADERLWADVLNRGGFDLLPTPFEEGEVRRVVEMAKRHGRRRLAHAC